MYDLEHRYGRTRWFNFLDIVRPSPAPLFPELTEPFFFPTHPTCLIPPSDLVCLRAGPLSATWTFERMPLSITTFIREKTGGRNSLYARHPELWDFCRISVHRNWIQDVPEISHPSETLAVDCDLWSRNRYLMPWDRGLLRRTRAVAPAAFWKHSAEIGWQASPWEATFHPQPLPRAATRPCAAGAQCGAFAS